MNSIEIIQKLKPGDHLCLLYEKEGDHAAVLGAFLRGGLEKGEKVLYIGDLEARRIGLLIGEDESFVNAARDEGRLAILSWDELKQKGELQADSFIDFLRSELNAGQGKYTGFRLATEATSFVAGMKPEELIEFESKLDRFLLENRSVGLCQYHLQKVDPILILDLLLTHPVIMNGMEAAENFFYSHTRELEKNRFRQVAAKHLLRILSERKALESKLLEEEKLLRNYIDIAGVVILVLDRNGNVRMINRKGCEVLEYRQEEIVGKNWFDHFLPERTRDKKRAYFAELLTGEAPPESGESPILTKSGKERILYWHSMAVRNERGEVEGTLSSGEDITERKLSELALQQSEGKYRELFENAVEGIFQITPEGRLISVNPAYAKMLGYRSPEEMIAGIADFAQQHYVQPEERKRFIEEIERSGRIMGFETQLYRLDGRKIWGSVNARTVEDGSGKVLYYEGMVEDVTDRKNSEERLNATLDNLREAMEGTIHAIAMTVEAKDPYTAGHQQHVGALARAIARHMRLPDDMIAGIYLSGVIHDLGKISIPSEFLAKPSKLTEYEYVLIKTHPEAGYKILRDIAFPWPVAEIVLQHHERIDGSGYPRGLKGGEILKEAKIIAIADVVEAITFHRPYRPAYGLNLALQEIRRNQGVLFDTECAEACLELFKKEDLPWQSLFEGAE